MDFSGRSICSIGHSEQNFENILLFKFFPMVGRCRLIFAAISTKMYCFFNREEKEAFQEKEDLADSLAYKEWKEKQAHKVLMDQLAYQGLKVNIKSSFCEGESDGSEIFSYKKSAADDWNKNFRNFFFKLFFPIWKI